MNVKKIVAGILCLVFLGAVLNIVVVANAPVVKTNATEGDRLYVAMQQDMPNFNDFDLGSNSIWKANVIGWCFDSLSRLDSDGNVVYGMGTWGVLDEVNLKVTVTLRDGIKFHDGTTMTADDVVFSYEILRDGATYSSNLVNAFDGDGDGKVSLTEIQAGVKKVDAKTIEFKMAKPYGQFFFSTLGIPILPKSIWKDHLTADGTIDVKWGTDSKAVIGTGPFVYKEGKDQVYRIIERFDGFWGKNITLPSGSKIWPAGVKEIYYKIYSNIDTAVLALESGDVDYIAWAVTAGKIPEVQANPNTQITFMPDNGYFYLAFNQKKEPVNNLPFRKAVSHVIDKTTAVNTYMGGYGVEGDSAEPPFWTQWYNSSVAHYAFDLNTAKSILDAANFKDTDSDGWRNMPDGRAIAPITILTPPADYDPIRIKIGTMVATNLRSIGIDATAKPVDFDTLVAKMNAFDYTMLIIGWSLTADPIGNVFDILGPTANSNTFGFWSKDHPNPFYVKTGGGGPIGTLADQATQDLADKVYDLGQKAMASFDTSEQIAYTKEAQGIISQAIPVNVLYYRVAAEGSSKAWTGWTPFMGSLFNTYTLANLKRAEVQVSVGAISAMFNAPAKVVIGEKGSASIYVFDNKGMPVKNASITLSSASTNVTFPAAGSTDTNGVFKFDVTGAGEGIAVINAKVSSGSLQTNTSATVQGYGPLPKTVYLSAIPSKSFLTAGQTSTISLETIDEAGNAVAGATVKIDKNQLKAGSIDKETLTTDATGKGTVTYTAPTTAIPNNHLSPTVAMEASKAGYTFGTLVQLSLVVVNNAASVWKSVTITNVDRIACSAANATAKIDVKAGATEKLTISYTNASVFTSPPTDVTTDSTGKATVTLTFKALAETHAVGVSFKDLNSPYAVSDTATLLYKGTTPPANPIYGGTISFTSKSLDPFGSINATINLRDIDNNVPIGTVKAGVAVSGTPDGIIAGTSVASFDAGYYLDYAGLIVSSSYDESQTPTAGPFGCDLDPVNCKDALIALLDGWYGVTMPPNATLAEVWTSWAENEYGDPALPMPASLDIVNGTVDITIDGTAASLRDLTSSLIIVPNALSTYDGVNWYITGDTTISSEIITYRGQDLITADFDMANPVISTSGTPANTTIDVTAHDQNNAVVSGASISIQSKVRTAATYTITKGGTGTTDTSGKATVTVEPNYANLKTAGFGTGTVNADLFIKASKAGYVSVMQVTKIVITASFMQLDLSVSPRTEATGASQTVEVTATAILSEGTPIKDANVTVSTSLGTVAPDYLLTDTAGKAKFTVTFTVTKFTTFPYFFVILKGKAEAAKTQGTGAQVQFEVYGTGPTVTLTAPINGQTFETDLDNVTVTLNSTVTDSTNVKEVYLKVDSAAPVKQAITPGKSVTLSVKVKVLATEAGETHTFEVSAVNNLNITEKSSLSITAKKKTTTGGNDMVLIAVIVVVIIAIVIVAVLMLMRKKGSKPAEAPAVAEAPPATDKAAETPKTETPPATETATPPYQ